MTTWEYLTTPLLIHNTAAILNNWGKQGWELVQVVQGPEGRSRRLPEASGERGCLRQRRSRRGGAGRRQFRGRPGMSVSARLANSAIELPAVAAPVAAYVPAVVHDGLVYTSGQLRSSPVRSLPSARSAPRSRRKTRGRMRAPVR